MKQPGDHFEFLWQIYALRTVKHQPQLSLEIVQKEEIDISAEWTLRSLSDKPACDVAL